MQFDGGQPQTGFAGAEQLVPGVHQSDQPRCLAEQVHLHRVRLRRGMDREPERPEEVQGEGGITELSVIGVRFTVYGIR